MADPDLAAFITLVCQNILDGWPQRSRERLVRTRLIPISKPDGGVRPIAIGSCLLKIASKYACEVHQESIRNHFQTGRQFGVLQPNGCEIIAHQARAAYNNGSSILTIDCKNAFNSPDRKKIYETIMASPVFAPFLGIFAVEYQNPSDLIWHPIDASHVRILQSVSGTRQGSVCGGLFFSALLHPLLVDLVSTFPEVTAWAYLDDLTFAGTPEELERVYDWLVPRLAVLHLSVNASKCELLVHPTAAAPDRLSTFVTVKGDGFIKIVGTRIGETTACSDALKLVVEKSRRFFLRLESLQGPAALALLSACGVPRATFISRTHPPEVSLPFLTLFENGVATCLSTLADTPITHETRCLAHLPRRDGGLGVTNMVWIAPIAYSASLAECCPNPSAEPAHDQRSGTTIFNERQVLPFLTPLQMRTIKETSERDTSAWLTAPARWNPLHFSAALRLRLCAPRLGEPSVLECAPCGKSFDAADYYTHVPGCVKRSGQNTTVKHNTLRDICSRSLRTVGIRVETEPREYKSYICQKCLGSFDKDAATIHARTCRNANFRPTGPDLRVEWPDSENSLNGTVYDWTIVHGCAPSLRTTPILQHFRTKAAQKHRLYDEQVTANGEELVVLAISAHGVISKDARQFAKRIARAMDTTTHSVTTQWSIALQKRNGATAAQARCRQWAKG
jgi:hypothetical protein